VTAAPGPGAAPPPALDAYIPRPDVRERFEVVVAAPAAVVLDAAAGFDLQRLRLVRAIFRARELLMRAPAAAPRPPRGIVSETLALGWGLLARDDRRIVVGARCQPWRGDVVFTPIAPERFADYAEPGQVTIAWTLEVEPIAPARTRFVHETRARATDPAARRRFLRYWRWARFGIIAIRVLMMPAVRREAEARWAATVAPPGRLTDNRPR
jgi:hypothetical protein